MDTLDVRSEGTNLRVIRWHPAGAVRADVLSGERAGVELVRVTHGSSAGFLEGGDSASALACSAGGARRAAAAGQ